MDLENLGHGGRTADVLHVLTGQWMPPELPSGGMPRTMRTAMRVHFLHQHVLENMVILEEVNLPQTR